MNEAELLFRAAERKLDELLRRDEAALAARGVTITDRSGRSYHYKNEHLFWSYQFETRRARGSEIEKVWVVVSLREDEPDSLIVWWRAEIFQIGKQSRWSITAEDVLPLEQAERHGLPSIVLGAIQEGEAAAAAA